jgi:hypothetical protein
VRSGLFIPSGLIVYLIVTGLLYTTSHAKASRNGDVLVFAPTATVRLLVLTSILGFAGAAFYVSFTPPSSLLGAVVFGLISVSGTLAFPADILVTSKGVSAVKWWGAKTEIPWNEVSRIEFHKGPATTVVLGKYGSRVVHSGWNRDGSGFRTSCEKNTGLSATTSRG